MFERVMVTGGAGFIGSHLVGVLVSRGCEVVVFDDLSVGRLKNVKEYLRCGKARLVKGDVGTAESVGETFMGVDAVFHLAAVTSVPFSVKHPEVTRRVNVGGTLNLLEASRRGDVKKFVFVSTCGVYGDPEYLPIDEKHPLKPISPYAESKLEAERLCMSFHEAYGLKTVVVRLFNVYGSGMRNDQYSGVVARFIKRLAAGKPPMIYGDGLQTRDFVHVSDVVSALVLACEKAGCVGEVFNVGSGVPTKINDLAQTLIEVFEAGGVKPVYRKARLGDIRESYACVEKAKVLLGFKPKVSLKEGLSKLVSSCFVEKGWRGWRNFA